MTWITENLNRTSKTRNLGAEYSVVAAEYIGKHPAIGVYLDDSSKLDSIRALSEDAIGLLVENTTVLDFFVFLKHADVDWKQMYESIMNDE